MLFFFKDFCIFRKNLFVIRKNVVIFAESNMMGVVCTFVSCCIAYLIWR